LDAFARRHEGQKIYLRQEAAQRWVDRRARILNGSRPHSGNRSALRACDQQLRAVRSAPPFHLLIVLWVKNLGPTLNPGSRAEQISRVINTYCWQRLTYFFLSPFSRSSLRLPTKMSTLICRTRTLPWIAGRPRIRV